MNYFVINCDEDGDIRVEQFFSQAKLNEALNNRYWGEVEFWNLKEEPLELDPQYWQNKILIIKGEAVVPKAVEHVTKFDIE